MTALKLLPPDTKSTNSRLYALGGKLQQQENQIFPETLEAGKFIVGSGEVTQTTLNNAGFLSLDE
ncbi:hypothetical protein OVA29_22005 [Exiguobacterium sp. SL14]|nr:hypothetical protein [Exiguobacterium sp. SL14]